MTQRDRILPVALAVGATAPLFYFGAQIAAAPFYPGYSFLRNAASDLGSNQSSVPAILNTGAIATGVVILVAAIAFVRAMRPSGIGWILTLLTALALLSASAASINAGIFPLPNPRHNPGWMGAGMFALPVLFAASLWGRSSAAMRAYLAANVVGFLLVLAVMSGKAGINTQGYEGLWQRVAAIVVFIPIAVVMLYLRRQVASAEVMESDPERPAALAS